MDIGPNINDKNYSLALNLGILVSKQIDIGIHRQPWANSYSEKGPLNQIQMYFDL